MSIPGTGPLSTVRRRLFLDSRREVDARPRAVVGAEDLVQHHGMIPQRTLTRFASQQAQALTSGLGKL